MDAHVPWIPAFAGMTECGKELIKEEILESLRSNCPGRLFHVSLEVHGAWALHDADALPFHHVDAFRAIF